MMRLLKISIDGFRAFKTRQEVVLPQEPGLYLMRGDNQVDEGLQSNDCIAGDSLIYDPVQKKHLRVDQIDKPFHVRSYNPSTCKAEIGFASKPFIRGRANLYKISLSTGESFVCTEKHIVLDAHGTWVQVGQLHVGDALLSGYDRSCLTESSRPILQAEILHSDAEAVPILHQQIDDLPRTIFSAAPNPTALNIRDVCILDACIHEQVQKYRSAYVVDAFHLSQIREGCLSRCFVDRRRCGEQPPLASSICQDVFPLSIGAHGHTHSLLHEGDLVGELEHIHICRVGDRLSNDRCVRLERHGNALRTHYEIVRSLHYRFFQNVRKSVSTFLHNLKQLAFQQFLYKKVLHAHTNESSSLLARVLESSYSPAITKETTTEYFHYITKIEFVKRDLFYDLKVWPYANYELAGVYHHNCGKSTMLDAIYWGLYGETTRGLRAGNVVSWGGKTAIVEQTWDIDGESHTFCRQQNPNSILIDGKRCGDRDVLELMGINGAEFLHSVMAGQFSTYFLDLSPTDKLGMFSEILGLDYWEKRADLAKGQSADCNHGIQLLSDKLQNVKGRLSSLKMQLVETEVMHAEWERKAKKKRRAVERDIAEYTGRRDDLNKKLNAVDKRMTDLGDERPLVDKISGLISERDSLARSIDKDSDDLRLSRCPFCGADLAKEWQLKLKKQLAVDKRRVLSIEEELDDARGKLRSTRVSVDKARRDIDALRSEYSTVCCQLQNAQEQEVEENPHASLVDQLNSDIAESRGVRKTIRSELNDATTMRDRYSFWVKGFRDLRLWVLDSTLAELELRINNSLIQLGMPRWSMHLAVERENKSGGVTKGFLVDVRSPESGEGSPWKGWGGGVSQRLRIAAEIGLGHLIADRKGLDIGCEWWDEPETHFSESGVQDLMDHLRARSEEEGRQIWVVSHRSIQYPFEGEMLVRKTAAGSEICM